MHVGNKWGGKELAGERESEYRGGEGRRGRN